MNTIHPRSRATEYPGRCWINNRIVKIAIIIAVVAALALPGIAALAKGNASAKSDQQKDELRIPQPSRQADNKLK